MWQSIVDSGRASILLEAARGQSWGSCGEAVVAAKPACSVYVWSSLCLQPRSKHTWEFVSQQQPWISNYDQQNVAAWRSMYRVMTNQG
mmetsp:Transcript_151602/g.484598  ORF Transcript_151602/g.484598 Transcript_151602/m.484598 type:complete len:88 (+) Transcript_151602:406-669(+)